MSMSNKRSLADRVALIEDGKVIATGRHEDLLLNTPEYAEVLAQVEADVLPLDDVGVDI